MFTPDQREDVRGYGLKPRRWFRLKDQYEGRLLPSGQLQCRRANFDIGGSILRDPGRLQLILQFLHRCLDRLLKVLAQRCALAIFWID